MQQATNVDPRPTGSASASRPMSRPAGEESSSAKDAVETASVRLTPEGAEVVIGTTAYGTGHATSWAQIVQRRVRRRDRGGQDRPGRYRTARHGFDSYGSRSLSVVGSALFEAATEVRRRATEVARRLLECDPDDLEFDGGVFTVRGTQRRRRSATWRWRRTRPDPSTDGFEPGLGCTRTSDLKIVTYPFGAHLAVVEVDVETGAVRLVDYVGVDDVGNVVNAMIVDGQVHGGAVQGIAQAMFEEVAYDEQANVLTPSFFEYAMPSAADLITMRTDRRVTPATTNPLGTKGVGRGGCDRCAAGRDERRARRATAPRRPTCRCRARRSGSGRRSSRPAFLLNLLRVDNPRGLPSPFRINGEDRRGRQDLRGFRPSVGELPANGSGSARDVQLVPGRETASPGSARTWQATRTARQICQGHRPDAGLPRQTPGAEPQHPSLSALGVDDHRDADVVGEEGGDGQAVEDLVEAEPARDGLGRFSP